MAPFLEFEEKNVEKAVKKACQELKIKEEKLKYDVISYGSTGIFGLVGVKSAKIRVILPEKKKETGRKEKGKEIKGEAPPSESETEEVLDKKIEIPRDAPDTPVEVVETIADFVETDDDESEDKADNGETEATRIQGSFEENLAVGQQVLQSILEKISEDVSFSLVESDDLVSFGVKGGNSGAIIGKRGQTLEAIQYILDKVINKGCDKKKRVEIDVEGYLEMRQAGLQSLAERLCEKAKRTGKPVVLGQMNSYERRIVHLTLKDDDAVRTQSIGNGFYRKMVIYPKKSVASKEVE